MKKTFRIIFKILIFIVMITGIGIGIVFNSPYTKLKDLWVTTAMKTMSHQYLAKIFVSDKEIANIMNRNRVVITTETVNLDNIVISKVQNNTERVANGLNNLISDDDTKTNMNTVFDDTIEKISIKGDGYNGTLLIVHDPSRIFVGVSNKIGETGQKLLNMGENYEIIGGINAGGFSDTNGVGNGGRGQGLTISEGKTLSPPTDKKVNLIGFNQDNKLIIGNYSLDQLSKMDIRDAVEFNPALIINGQATKIIGDGGWGIQPRTCIGQRKDGSVLLLAIDGRQISSIGITIKKLQEIMITYGAENATNLDGGSSTTMTYKNEIINKPCSSAGPRYLPNGFFIKETIKSSTFVENKK